jgi:hypothetical protein
MDARAKELGRSFGERIKALETHCESLETKFLESASSGGECMSALETHVNDLEAKLLAPASTGTGASTSTTSGDMCHDGQTSTETSMRPDGLEAEHPEFMTSCDSALSDVDVHRQLESAMSTAALSDLKESLCNEIDKTECLGQALASMEERLSALATRVETGLAEVSETMLSISSSAKQNDVNGDESHALNTVMGSLQDLQQTRLDERLEDLSTRLDDTREMCLQKCTDVTARTQSLLAGVVSNTDIGFANVTARLLTAETLARATADFQAMILKALQAMDSSPEVGGTQLLHAERLGEAVSATEDVLGKASHETHENFAQCAAGIGEARETYDVKLGEVEQVLAEVAAKLAAVDVWRKHQDSHLEGLAAAGMNLPLPSSDLVEAENHLEERLGAAAALLEELLGDETPRTEAGLIEASAKLAQAKLGLQEQVGIVMANLDDKLGCCTPTSAGRCGLTEESSLKLCEPHPHLLAQSTPSTKSSSSYPERVGVECLHDAISDLEGRLTKVTSVVQNLDEVQSSADKRVCVVERRLDNRIGASSPRFEPTAPQVPRPRVHTLLQPDSANNHWI